MTNYSIELPGPPSTEAPVYRKVQENNSTATKRYMIVCDEGWRLSILCTGMYERAADFLLEVLGRRSCLPSREAEIAACTLDDRDRLRLLNEWFRLLSMLGGGIKVLSTGTRRSASEFSAVCSYRAPDGREYEVTVTDRG